MRSHHCPDLTCRAWVIPYNTNSWGSYLKIDLLASNLLSGPRVLTRKQKSNYGKQGKAEAIWLNIWENTKQRLSLLSFYSHESYLCVKYTFSYFIESYIELLFEMCIGGNDNKFNCYMISVYRINIYVNCLALGSFLHPSFDDQSRHVLL